jgi:ribosomal-protein-alanine N-acetyltransferase
MVDVNPVTPDPVTLQPLTVHHLEAVVQLDHDCFGGLWSQEGYRWEIDSPNSDLFGLWHPSPAGAIAAPQLIGLGCCWAILDEAHITLLGIHPHYQRQGLGQTLLLALLAAARHRGLQWATLEVRESNQAARSLYSRYGFQEVGRRRRYYPDTGEDGLILWCKGLQDDAMAHHLQQQWLQTHQRLRHRWQLFCAIPAIASYLSLPSMAALDGGPDPKPET